MAKKTKTKREYITERDKALKESKAAEKKTLKKTEEIGFLEITITNLNQKIEELTFKEWRVTIKPHTWKLKTPEAAKEFINNVLDNGLFFFNCSRKDGKQLVSFSESSFTFSDKKAAEIKFGILKNVLGFGDFVTIEGIK